MECHVTGENDHYVREPTVFPSYFRRMSASLSAPFPSCCCLFSAVFPPYFRRIANHLRVRKTHATAVRHHSNAPQPWNNRQSSHGLAKTKKYLSKITRSANSPKTCNKRHHTLEARIRQNRVTLVRSHSKHKFANSSKPCNSRRKALQAQTRQNRVTAVGNHSNTNSPKPRDCRQMSHEFAKPSPKPCNCRQQSHYVGKTVSMSEITRSTNSPKPQNTSQRSLAFARTVLLSSNIA